MPQEIRLEGLIASDVIRRIEGRSTFPVNQIFVPGGQDYVIDPGTFSAGPTYTVATLTADILMQQHHDDRDRISALEREVSELRSEFDRLHPPVRDLTLAQAKKEIHQYFGTHDDETVYPSDIADELHLDYGLVTKAIAKLAAEGKIAEAE